VNSRAHRDPSAHCFSSVPPPEQGGSGAATQGRTYISGPKPIEFGADLNDLGRRLVRPTGVVRSRCGLSNTLVKAPRLLMRVLAGRPVARSCHCCWATPAAWRRTRSSFLLAVAPIRVARWLSAMPPANDRASFRPTNHLASRKGNSRGRALCTTRSRWISYLLGPCCSSL
jgi:hypothetical protein